MNLDLDAWRTLVGFSGYFLGILTGYALFHTKKEKK